MSRPISAARAASLSSKSRSKKWCQTRNIRCTTIKIKCQLHRTREIIQTDLSAKTQGPPRKVPILRLPSGGTLKFHPCSLEWPTARLAESSSKMAISSSTVSLQLTPLRQLRPVLGVLMFTLMQSSEYSRYTERLCRPSSLGLDRRSFPRHQPTKSSPS